MRDTSHLTDDELRALMSKPLTKEEADQLRKIRKADKWLFALNFQDMDREENKPKANGNPTK